MSPKILSLFRGIVVRTAAEGRNDRGNGEMAEVGRREKRKRGENARHVSARRDVISKDQLQ